MGVDIYTKSGVLFTLDEAVNSFFKGLSRKSIIKIIEECLSFIDDNEKVFIKNISGIDDLKSWFINYTINQIEDNYIQNQTTIKKIWDCVLSKTKYKNLPEIELEYFVSARYNGYDVPLDTVCVVFSDQGLFETKMTKKGIATAKLMGQRKISQTSWTIYSY